MLESPPQLETGPRGYPGYYPWVVIGMLWFLCFCNYADRVAIGSVFPELEKHYHFNKEQLGLIGAAFTWVYALGSPLAGYVGDHFARKRVILIGLYIWSLVTGLTAQCTQLWQFVLVRGSEGMGEAFYMPASMALISDYHTTRTRSAAIGLHQTSIYAGTVFGASMAGWMALHYRWQTPFWVFGIAGIVLGLVMQFGIREPYRNEAETRARGASVVRPRTTEPLGAFLKEFVRTPTAVLLILAFFGANMVGAVFLTWMPTYLKEKFHLDLAQAGLGATIFTAIASMIGCASGGVIADRWSRHRPEGRILLQAIAVLAGVPFVFLCGYTRELWMLAIAMTLFGFSKGLYDSNLTAAFYDVIAPSRRSTATGIMNLIGWIGGGLGAFAIGYAVHHHTTMSAAISSTAIVYFAVACILFYTARFPAANDIRRHLSSAE